MSEKKEIKKPKKTKEESQEGQSYVKPKIARVRRVLAAGGHKV